MLVTLSLSDLVETRLPDLKETQKCSMFDSGACDWLVFPLLLPTYSMDHKRRSRKRNRKEWKRSNAFDSDSVEFMTSLMTRFPLSCKCYYDSDYDNDPVAIRKAPLTMSLWNTAYQTVCKTLAINLTNAYFYL